MGMAGIVAQPTFNHRFVAFLLAGWLAGAPGMAAAQAPWDVSGAALVGKTRKGAPQPSADVSGLACAGAVGAWRKCLIVDDESQGAQVVMLKEGSLHVGDPVPLIDTKFGRDKPVELDAEAVAFADDDRGGAFYVIGSHGRPRHPDPGEAPEDEAKAKSSKHVFRIAAATISDAGKIPAGRQLPPSGDLTGFLQADYRERLKDAYDRPLETNGMSIEGLAVRDHTMFVGFRGPVLAGRAQVLSVPVDAVFDHGVGKAELVPLDLGKDVDGTPRGVRDLVTFGDAFLVLAGPEYDRAKYAPPRCGDYSVYLWKGHGPEASRLRDLDAYSDTIRAVLKDRYDPKKPPKPEGLLPLDAAGRRALIVFDGPPNGWPVAVDLNDGFACPR
jgi:hypothetical protein